MEEKRPRRPRIAPGLGGQITPMSSDANENKVNEEQISSSNYNNSDFPRQQGRYDKGYNQEEETNYQRGSYRPGNYNRNNGYQQAPGGYQQRQGNYQNRQRPYQNRQGSYQPRNAYGSQDYNQNQRAQRGDYQQNNRPYQPRTNNYQPRQGGYGQNPHNGYQNRNRYHQSQDYQQQSGNYQPNQNYQHSGDDANRMNSQNGFGQRNQYRPMRQGGFQQRQQGYQPRQNGGYQQPYNRYNPNGRYQQNRQGGYGRRNQPQRPRQIDYVLEDIDPNVELRLNKFMANAGLCSRREADEYISKGLVKVNGETVTELGTKISRSDLVEYNGKVVTPERKCYVLLNKPKSCVTTSDDPQGRLTVLDLVKNACQERIYPVGRLDRNTTGVLLLTNDGDLASKLTHPKYVKKKIYHVWTDKEIAEEDMQRIADGIELEDGEIHADAISYVNDEDKNQAGIEIHSGRNRIVRRIFEKLGYRVIKLDRVYFAGLTKKNLPRGRWRYLTQEEVNFLRMGSFE